MFAKVTAKARIFLGLFSLLTLTVPSPFIIIRQMAVTNYYFSAVQALNSSSHFSALQASRTSRTHGKIQVGTVHLLLLLLLPYIIELIQLIQLIQLIELIELIELR